MNKAGEQKTKAVVAAMCRNIHQNRKELYKNLLSLIGGEFGEAEEEAVIGWLGAGVYINKTEKPAPCGEAEKPAARRPLLRYQREEVPQWGLNNTGGIR
jgi:hypothetical protein